ncbi:MAG: response regulator [Spirochaetales bacterium]|nr:response regulator [Spirochaetales bacterium]
MYYTVSEQPVQEKNLMSRQKMHILLVEDEAITALMFKSNLEAAGYEVHTPIATGESAVKAVQTEKFDLILMDIHLAGDMDGIQAAEKISLSCCIPIIFMTGYSDCDVRLRARELRPAAYLVKPVSLKDIKSAIEFVFTEQGLSGKESG